MYMDSLMFNSNIWLNSAHLQDIKLQNLNDLDFDLSMSLKVKCNGAIGLAHMVYSILMFIMITYGLTRLVYEM